MTSINNTVWEFHTDGFSEFELRKNMASILKAKDPKKSTPITDLTRVNEQDMYAAVVLTKLQKINPALADKFLSQFESGVAETLKTDLDFGVFETVRKIIRRFRKVGEIATPDARILQKESLGLAQLDSRRDLLATKNISGKVGDTALRAIKTAIQKFKVNVGATDQEFSAFKLNNATRRAAFRAIRH